MYYAEDCRKCGAPLHKIEKTFMDAVSDIKAEAENNKSDEKETEIAGQDNAGAAVELKSEEEASSYFQEDELFQDIEWDDILNDTSVQEAGAINKADSSSKAEIHPETVLKTVNIIKDSKDKDIIALNGPEGSGKSAVLNQLSRHLSNEGYLVLYGSCTPLVQITSFGFFQDAFLRMMKFPPYIQSTELFIKEFKKSNYAKLFSFLNGSDLALFLNILYPSQKDIFDNILKNKEKIFSILERVIKTFISNRRTIILIDNFELLDGASYDFIVHLIKRGLLGSKLKFIAAYQGDKEIKSYFDISGIDKDIFETIKINGFDKNELFDISKRSSFVDIRKVLSQEEVNQIIENAGGNALRIEQETALLFDTGFLSRKENKIIVDKACKPSFDRKSFEELIKYRISLLPPSAKNVLFTAAMMGCRFSQNILFIASPMPSEKAEELLEFLVKKLYIKSADNHTCEFQNLTMWNLIYKEAKADTLYKENAKRLYLSLKPLLLSSSLQKLISCTEALSSNEEFLIWQGTAGITAKLGDINLYVIALKQCLKLIDSQDTADIHSTKFRMYEEMGKLLCEKSPKEAAAYLSNVLDAYIKKMDIRKIIDISGYFVKSSCLAGNCFGAVEAVDTLVSVLSKSADVSELEIALIKTRKLNSLINIGNLGQVITIAADEIAPVLAKSSVLDEPDSSYRRIVLDAWFNSQTALARAYALQGNYKAASKTISDINEAFKKYKYKNDFYKISASLAQAAADTAEGNINSSDKILNEILERYELNKKEPKLYARLSLMRIINKVLLGKTDELNKELSGLEEFADNINEHFIKNAAKLTAGYAAKINGVLDKAEEIYNEQIVYFSKEKMALGALAAWALIVQKYIENDNTEKALLMALKSLEIAQSAKISNYLASVYFQRLLTKIYVQKGDFAAAKMYLEKAVIAARKLNLKYMLILLYSDYAHYVQELMNAKKVYSEKYTASVINIYKKAAMLAKELELENMTAMINKEYADFKAFCRLNAAEA